MPLRNSLINTSFHRSWLITALVALFSQLTLVVAEENSPRVSVHGYIPTQAVIPCYPHKALLRQQEGFVTVQFRVNSEGLAGSFKILGAQPRGVFEATAIASLKRSRFVPTAMHVSQTFTFSLTGEFSPKPKISTFGKTMLTAFNNH